MKTIAEKVEVCHIYGNLTDKTYRSTMGGTTKIIVTNKGEAVFEKIYDERLYKYISGLKCSKIEVTLSLDELNLRYKEAIENLKKLEKDRQKVQERYELFQAKGLYGMVVTDSGVHVALSAEESDLQFFDAERLANSLDISVCDAKLLNSKGKTYVFAKCLTSEKTLMLYHASLSCNPLTIWVEEATKKQIDRFTADRESWVNAPFAEEVGQSNAISHFVC